MTLEPSLAKHWIGGSWTGSASAAEAASADPATGAVIGRFADGGAREVRQAIEAARMCFDASDWSRSPRLRQRALLDWAARLEEQQERIARLLTLENGKILAQARGEVAAAVSELRYYAGLARAIRGHTQEIEPGVFSTVRREAAGVVGVIVPWNGPVLLLIRSVAPALCAGCACVVKPAPQTPLVTVATLELLAQSPHAPPGVVNLVMETGREAGELLAASPDIDVISFTGSTETGRKVAAAAAPTMKKLSLELGGKACCLVFEDVNVAVVASALAKAATIISGQQCTAARRVLVHESRVAEMRDALRFALAGIVVGPGLDADSQMGPLIDCAARDRIERSINEACKSCDEVLLRARRPSHLPQAGAYITPALIAHSDPNAFFCQEEIFGPLVVIETFASEQEAIAKANNTAFGLAASVWTHDGARSLRVASALRNGTVWINDHNQLCAEIEMGGYRRSGLGRLHGVDALSDFTELKHVYQNAGRLQAASAAP